MAQADIKQESVRPHIGYSAPPIFRYSQHTEDQRSIATPELSEEIPSSFAANLKSETCDPSSSSNMYLGSDARGTRTLQSSRTTSREASPNSACRNTSYLQLEHLLSGAETVTETFDIDESRDGFFDATFYRPSQSDIKRMFEQSRDALPASFRKLHPLSFLESFCAEWRSFGNAIKDIVTTRSGIQLLKSFLGFFIAYVICLVPASGRSLGRYNYIMVVSCIINHPGRAIGSQVDGALQTILGTAVGLAWGSLALYVSTTTAPARVGYGGILATFLILFTWTLAWLRCIFIRFYPAILCAGFAVCYACLANTSDPLSWNKMGAYGVPWVLGQAISLVVCLSVFPATGTRQL